MTVGPMDAMSCRSTRRSRNHRRLMPKWLKGVRLKKEATRPDMA